MVAQLSDPIGRADDDPDQAPGCFDVVREALDGKPRRQFVVGHRQDVAAKAQVQRELGIRKSGAHHHHRKNVPALGGMTK